MFETHGVIYFCVTWVFLHARKSIVMLACFDIEFESCATGLQAIILSIGAIVALLFYESFDKVSAPPNVVAAQMKLCTELLLSRRSFKM